MKYPERIVCLTEETVETLYLIGEGDRVVGVSGYTVRPPEARKKPRVSAFINARYDKIEALRPDLILAFSDLQADIAAELIRRGYNVVTFNQRSVEEILQMIVVIGRIVGRGRPGRGARGRPRCRARRDPPRERRLRGSAARLLRGVGSAAHLGHSLGRRAHRDRRRRSDLLRAARSSARPRIESSTPTRWSARNPDVIFASWCGKAMKKRTIVERQGWKDVNAVRHDRIYEIKSTYILQPGPASLTEGVRQLGRTSRTDRGGRLVTTRSACE